MSSLPLWVRSPEVQQLLNRLVDSLDGSELRGASKTRSLALSNRTWPALYDASRESTKEHLWEHVTSMCDWGWLSISPANARRSASGYSFAPRLSVVDVAAVRAATGRTERLKSADERWREAVEVALDAPAPVKQAVSEFRVELPGHSMVEVVERLNRLPSLRGRSMLLREVSSHLFWGMSKVLDGRQALVAALLQEDDCPFAELPVQLQVWLPPTGYSGVLFIENAASFEKAIRSGSNSFQHMAIVYAAGFKAGAQRLRVPGGASVFYSGSGDLSDRARGNFEDWLFQRLGEHAPYFWGDLDFSGMRILCALRCTFSAMSAWQPGYRPMLDSLRAGGGHLPGAADKLGQRPVERTGCPFADAELLPTLHATGRFIDQEAIPNLA